MSMSFDESLQRICSEIIGSPEDCQSYNEDAEVIRQYLILKMKEYDSTFNQAFDNLNLPEDYMDRWKINFPDEFDCYMKLRMPFSITPASDFIVLNTNVEHPIVHDDRICRRCLQEWIRKIIINVLSSEIYWTVNGRIYMIEYPKKERGYGVAHTILAKEVVSGKREFSFNLVPAFEFKKCEWLHDMLGDVQPFFAVPFGKKLYDVDGMSPNEFSFMVCEPHLEGKILQEKPKLQNSLRLMKALCGATKIEFLTSYLLKNIFLSKLQFRPDEFCDQPMGVMLIEEGMIEMLLLDLSDGKLRFILYEGFHNIEALAKQTAGLYSALDFAFINFSQFQHEKIVKYDDIAALFKRELFDEKYGTARLLYTLICDKSNRDSSN